MKSLFKSRLTTIVFVGSVMFILTACDAVTAADIISPEALGAAALLPFLMGDTANMGEITDLIKKQGDAWEQYKSANDARLKAIDNNGVS